MNVQRLVTLLCLCFSTDAIQSEFNKSSCNKFVTIPRYGSLKGSISKTTWTNRSIYQFLGVRYAESPSGKRRFKAPVPVKPWKGVRDVTNFGRKCPTLIDLAAMTEMDRRAVDLEDCLNMAIYSPNLSGSFPVMVFVHGGSFYLHSAIEFPPGYILERDVVLVVVQYRLDALGFLSTNSEGIPGNAGLMDVQLALNFVKENIAHFGGNPNSVTLFGQSAGAVIVSALTISPVVPQNLFHRAIIQSGSVFARWSCTTEPVKDARDIAAAAGMNGNQSIASLNEAFIKMDVFDLLSAVDRYQNDPAGGPLKFGARSISIGGPNNFIPDLPMKIVASPQYKKTIPMITGTTKDDGSYVVTLIYDFLQASGLANGQTPIIPILMEVMCGFFNVGDKCKTFQSIITSIFWTEAELASNDFATIATGLTDLLGMFLFKVPALQLAMSNMKSHKTNTFLYTFDYEGQKTRFGYGDDTSHYPFKGGVTHSDDLIYLFPYPPEVTNLNEADTQMANELLDLWTSFAKNGWPQTVRNGCSINEVSWPPLRSGTFGPYARIDKELTIESYYPKEFVRNVSEEKKIDYKQLLALLVNLE